MRILIIGAKGMLGTKLCEEFSSLKPTCWDRDEIDITDEEQVREKIIGLHPDVVINVAAYTDVDGAESNRDAAFAVNEAGVRNLAKAVKDINGKLVHYSTDYVFPGDNKVGYGEDDAPGPAINTYGDSKLAGERALKEVDVDFYLLRTAWLYGEGGKNFVDTMLKLAKDRDSLSVIDDQHGGPTFTGDVARATREILEGEYALGIYHVVNSGMTSWYGFAQEIFSVAGIDIEVKAIPTEEYPLPAKRPKYSVLQNIKGPKMRSWKEALKEYVGS
jgi:dTDP-4-dehydrorhamnose reductase